VPRPHWHLEIRIVKTPPPSFEGFDTSRFEVGLVYDVNSPLCDLLVTSGYAVENVKSAADAVPPSPATTSHANDKPPRKRRSRP